MSDVSPEKMAEWREKASKKEAIVPFNFEVSPYKASIVCGECRREFSRNLIFGLDEPVFVCPDCRARNWVPVRYKIRNR